MRAYSYEVGVGLTTIIGWLLIVWGVASLTHVMVWPIGIGVALLGFVGYRLLWIIVTTGLYTLSQDDTDESDQGGG